MLWFFPTIFLTNTFVQLDLSIFCEISKQIMSKILVEQLKFI